MNRHNVTAVVIDLKIEEAPVVFILLASDGTVNRMHPERTKGQKELFIGVAPGLLDQLMEHASAEVVKQTGGFTLQNARGKVCKLSMGFHHADESVTGFEYTYGTETPGPPNEVTGLVRKAVEITDPWFGEQLKAARKKRPAKPKPRWFPFGRR